MNTPVTHDDAIAELCALDRGAFTQRLEGIFEHSPWIAARSWEARPFADVDALHAAMLATLAAASQDEKLALIRAHPELAGKEAEAGTLTTASTGEIRPKSSKVTSKNSTPCAASTPNTTSAMASRSSSQSRA